MSDLPPGHSTPRTPQGCYASKKDFSRASALSVTWVCTGTERAELLRLAEVFVLRGVLLRRTRKRYWIHGSLRSFKKEFLKRVWKKNWKGNLKENSIGGSIWGHFNWGNLGLEGTGEPWGLLEGGNEMSSKCLHFGVHLDSSGPAKFLQNPLKILPKSIQNPPRTLLVGSPAKVREISTKCFDFGLHLGSPGRPFWLHF